MNRAQRRAAAKRDSSARLRRMDREAYDRYQARAKRWLIGACYEGVPITREEGGETIHGLTGYWRFSAATPVSRRESVADYAASSPLRWDITVEAIFRDERGHEYREQAGGPIGQALVLGELTDHWRALLDEARAKGNPNHHWGDVVRCWPLVTTQRGDA